MKNNRIIYAIAAVLSLIAATLVILALTIPTKEPLPASTPEVQPTSVPSAQIFDANALNSQIAAICPTGSGNWDIYLEDLRTGEVFISNSVAPGSGVSASLIKLFIMGAVYSRIAEGTFDYSTVYPLLFDMITVSSNDAANELTRMLGGGSETDGMAAVNAFADSIGCTSSRMNRLMLVDNGLQNYTSSADCARFLRMLYSGICISPDYSAEMLNILRAQQVNDRIPAGLPAGTPVAHKTGDLSGIVFGDTGIVFSPKGDYVLCIMCENPPDYGNTIARFGQLSEYIFNSYYK